MTSVSALTYGHASGSAGTNTLTNGEAGFDRWFTEVMDSYSDKRENEKAAGPAEEAENSAGYHGSEDNAVVSLDDELTRWLHMTLAERLRAQYLADHDLTEEQVAILPQDERTKLENAIVDYIKTQMKLEQREAGAEA